MRAVRLPQELLHEEGLGVLLQLEHVSAQRQRVHATRHHAPELLQQDELLQDPPQDRPVEAPAVVAHQERPAEALEERDEVGEGARVWDGGNGAPVEEQGLAGERETRDPGRPVSDAAAGQEVRVKRPVPADGRQLHDVTRRRV